MSRRRSTLFDAAALRLHPNGVRVPSATGTIFVPQDSAVTVKNTTNIRRAAKGNWIATDAGGDGKVTKRRKVIEDRLGITDLNASQSNDLVEPDTAKARSHVGEVFKDARTKRRIAFEKDLTFLAAPTSEIEEIPSSYLQPSSDFLKCIHHFASHHYTANGQLFDVAKQYRKEKKERRERSTLRGEALGLRNSESRPRENDATRDGEDSTENDGSESEIPSGSKKGKEKPKQWRSKRNETNKDMYKAFDGSALLCIGMLLQFHISSSLHDSRPDSWETDVSAYDSKESEEGTAFVAPRRTPEDRATAATTRESPIKGNGAVTGDPEINPLDNNVDMSEVDESDAS